MNEINLKKAMKIYYFLLKEGELTLDSNKELYIDYSDSDIRYIVELLASESELIIEKFNQVIYLIPKEENEVFGIKDMDMQKVISYDARKIDFYLSQYIILMIINVFFSGKGNYIKSRDFIRISELEEIITSRLKYLNAKKNVQDSENESKLNIKAMYEHWNALQIDDSSKRKTKYGYIRSVSSFLEKHKLIIYDFKEDDIRPTTKFTHLMTYNFLDSTRMEVIEKYLS